MKLTTTLLLGGLLLPVALISTTALGDDDEHEGFRGWFSEARLDVAPVNNPAYLEECGSCHFAYQPGLLPARSWERVMSTLDDHFGDNAELDDTTRNRLLDYLRANDADSSDYKRSRGFSRSIGRDQAPRRITEARYFVRKHDEVPSRIVTGNDKVGSFSNCSACHPRAETGSYNEHEIRIPGIGRWED